MSIFVEISIVLVIATLIAALMRLLRQPLIMGHIITGLIVGPLFLGFTHSRETLEIFSEFGVSILLFIVGLHLSPKVAREVGKVAVFVGFGQVLFTSVLGFAIAKALGFTTLSSAYIAISVTLSSTIIVLKLLSDKRDIEKLYGKIAIGLLLVQDIVATFVLIAISAFASGGGAATLALALLVKGIGITLILFAVSKYVFPVIGPFFAKSQEFLFIFSIGWGFGLASLFEYIGFSVEIGALMAGVVLSVSPYAHEISAKLKPLRDFFIVLFFVYLGSSLTFDSLGELYLPLGVFSIFVLVLEPLIIILLMALFRYNKKTTFLTGISMAQVSEFSLIIVLLGFEVGHIGDDVLSLITLLAVVTIAVSSYLINYGERIYPHLMRYLKVFERKAPIEETESIATYEVFLFGANRVGYDFLTLFKRIRANFLTIDFDPQIIKALKAEGVAARYGDAEDSEFLEELDLSEAKMVVSTIPDYETNAFLVEHLRQADSDAIVIMISNTIEDALKLYADGATYVVLPHFIGGHFAALLAAENWFNIDSFTKERDKHIKYLTERKDLGHEIPRHKTNRF